MTPGHRGSGSPWGVSERHDVAGATAEMVLLVLQVMLVVGLVVVVDGALEVVVGGQTSGRDVAAAVVVVRQAGDAGALVAEVDAGPRANLTPAVRGVQKTGHGSGRTWIRY